MDDPSPANVAVPNRMAWSITSEKLPDLRVLCDTEPLIHVLYVANC
jgi:hypothetical protein